MTRSLGVPLRIASMSTSVPSFESAILLFSGVANGDTNIHDPIPQAGPHVSTHSVYVASQGIRVHTRYVLASFASLDITHIAVFV